MLYIYLLSISENVQGVCVAVAFVSGLPMLVLFFMGAIEGDWGPLNRHWKKLAPIAIIAALLAASIPSRRDVVESYLLIQGKDLATSDNVKMVLKKIDEKADALINANAKAEDEATHE